MQITLVVNEQSIENKKLIIRWDIRVSIDAIDHPWESMQILEWS